MEIHLYDGSIDQSALCDKCGLPAKSNNHFLNGGVPCDMPTGPCACGAWHQLSDWQDKFISIGSCR